MNKVADADVTAGAPFVVNRAISMPREAIRMARVSIFDCLAVGIAGSTEPVSSTVREGPEIRAQLHGLLAGNCV